MSRSSDTKQRFIKTAAILFQEKGYSSVGLSELIKKANAPKGSFYHHFPDGKEELAKAALAYSGQFMQRRMVNCFTEAHSLEEGARNLLLAVADWFEESDWTLGCPITTIALEMTPANIELHTALRDVFDGWIEAISEHATRLGSGEPREWAQLLLTQTEGAWIMARLHKSRSPFEQIMQLYSKNT